ncbi:MAG: PP2C family protein-serine/threonine phosphatase [Ruminiclostridium sp.]
MFDFFQKKKDSPKRKLKISKTVQIPKISQPGIDVIIDDIGTRATLKFGNAQHIGNRKQQEDSFGYSNIVNSDEISQKGVFAVLADGMGGLSHGKQISEYVVSAAITMFENFVYTLPFPQQLEDIVIRINKEISQNFSTNGKSIAGSTMVAAFLYRTKLYWVGVGDSRIYILRDGLLYQVNEDHDYFNEMLVKYMYGDISLDNAKNHNEKDSLTSYIGNEKLPRIDSNKRGLSLQKNDTIILCSDGVYNSIDSSEFVLQLLDEPQPAVEKIVKSIIKKKLPSQDNLTIMIINYN